MGDILDWVSSFFSASEEEEKEERIMPEVIKREKKERKKQHEWQDVNEQIKYVCQNGKVSCPYSSSPTGDIVVSSTEVKLQDVFQVTAGDNKSAPDPSLLFSGKCTLAKWGNNKPMCKSVISLTNWENISETFIDNNQALLRKSTIKCTQSNENISIVDSGQKAFLSDLEPKSEPVKPAPSGYYYSEDGIFLGKIGHLEDVYLTDKTNFEKMKKREKYDESNVIEFTKKYNFTNKELLNRANWVYGEGGGNFPDHYAHAIVNLKNHGVWGPANKPFVSDEAMYKKKMTHQITTLEDGVKKKKIINMYPGYFNGTDGGQPAKAFAKARINPEMLNKLNVPKANLAIKAVIGSIMGTMVDPTNGCYQWVGGAGSSGPLSKNPAANNATGVVNVTADGRYNTFYKLDKE